MAQKLSIPFFLSKSRQPSTSEQMQLFYNHAHRNLHIEGKKCEAKLCGSLLWQLQRNQANTVKVENTWDRMITERNMHIHD